MSKVTYTVASEANVGSIQAVAAEAWKATYKDIYPADFINSYLERAYSSEDLLHSVHNPEHIFLVAKDEQRVVGYCHAGPGSDGPELYRLYVIPGQWRTGIGSGLLEQLEARLLEQGALQYSLNVHKQNEIGKNFYIKMKFMHDAAHDSDQEWRMRKYLLNDK